LKVRGTVSQTGKQIDEGNVRLTVWKVDGSFQQAVAIGIKGGQFETDDVAFRPLTPTDRIHIRADVTSSKLNVPTTQDLYFNTAPPSLSPVQNVVLWTVVGVIFLAILLFFFSTFTGQRTPRKNRY